ncbi:MAG: hypothetical protein Q9M19_04815 [Mariprofundaceae bacterium]|nr:hypothetical protein [Mariprofundaceae bacterium]
MIIEFPEQAFWVPYDGDQECGDDDLVGVIPLLARDGKLYHAPIRFCCEDECCLDSDGWIVGSTREHSIDVYVAGGYGGWTCNGPLSLLRVDAIRRYDVYGDEWVPHLEVHRSTHGDLWMTVPVVFCVPDVVHAGNDTMWFVSVRRAKFLAPDSLAKLCASLKKNGLRIGGDVQFLDPEHYSLEPDRYGFHVRQFLMTLMQLNM